ncbi:hypothetical protein [Flavobacterium sp. JAS]|uniref:hypothetical protein n=1 Tax=Flavobacterium sp. JAS TaxID=2897329 RepID=UPI001E4D7C5A|nr:hypothetical protein [Flavobacterium sp. JAS]MCD0472577.1 hypothetical protein [Flavobacterium sp. JAS]
MKSTYLILTFFFTISVNAQIEIIPYEQIAVNYFAEELSESYNQLKYLVFDGNLEMTSPLPYSFCMVLKKVDNYEETENVKVNIPYPILKKIGFLKKLFISNRKIGNVYVFKHYPKEDDIVVVINVTNKNIDDYYSILIDKKTKKAINSCKKTYYQ